MRDDRPDLSQVSPEVLTYIRSLEAEIDDLQGEIETLKARGRSGGSSRSSSASLDTPPANPSEPPTTLNLITLSRAGFIKRTARHHYLRQRRGGMGIFDIDLNEEDHPCQLAVADESSHLILLTNEARVFRLRLGRLDESPIRNKGQSLRDLFPLHPKEEVVAALPENGGTTIAILTERGHVRSFRANVFGENLRNGFVLFDIKQLGPPSAACWANGNADFFIATVQGRAIRFAEKLVPVRGCMGIRLGKDDRAVAIATVSDDSGVFLLTADGKGTIRQMSGFGANKAAGAGGKIAIKSDAVVGAARVSDEDDIFAISQLSKIIRFQAIEVPPKEGTVQGVNCLALRNDTVTALLVSPPGT